MRWLVGSPPPGEYKGLMGTDRSRTEERQDVDGEDPFPPFDGLPGVASATKPVSRRLEETFFDTPDLALLRSGTTLSRTVGGDEPGWHLQLPDDGSWREVTEPLGRATKTVPKRLRSLVVGQTRGASLVPVAVISTSREVRRLRDEQGQVLAEVSEEQVQAIPAGADESSASTWSEWRVELVEGRRDLQQAVAALPDEVGGTSSAEPSRLARVLAHRLDDGAGVSPTPRKKGTAATVVQGRLAEQVTEIRRLDPLVRCDVPEAVHRMRVAIRRLRSALATYRPLLEREVTDPIRDELAWLGQALGEVRDTEVVHQRLRRLLAEEPVENVRGDVSSQVDRAMTARYGEARARCLEAMETPRYFALLERLDELVAEPPFAAAAGERAQDVLPRTVLHDWKRLRRSVGSLDGAEDAVERSLRLHAVRKAAKRARYAAEPLTDLYGKDARRFVKAATRVQTALGEHHDSTVIRQLLREQADAWSAGEDTAFTYGVLHVREETRAAAAEAEFAQAWRAASGKRLRRWLS
jgi:CHAD domain-containing protein